MFLYSFCFGSELDSDGKLINDSRAMRIARGAGVHPICIREVLEVFKPFQKAAAGMKKMNLPIGKNGDISKMAAGKIDMKQMASMLPAGMVQKMGGMQGLQVCRTICLFLFLFFSVFQAMLPRTRNLICFSHLHLFLCLCLRCLLVTQMQNMMKQMASGGMAGMPGMGDMMKMMGGGK